MNSESKKKTGKSFEGLKKQVFEILSCLDKIYCWSCGAYKRLGSCVEVIMKYFC